MGMKLIMYSSTAVIQSKLSVPTGLSPIVNLCRKNNPIHSIGGALYYRYGRYLHIIEGETKKIDQLMSNILKDSRHKNCLITLETKISQRIYPHWQCQLNMVVKRDIYLRKFLAQYSNQLKSMDYEMAVGFNHFFKKDFSIPISPAMTMPSDVFGSNVLSLDSLPDVTSTGATLLMMNLCRLLIKHPCSVDQLVNEYGEDKRCDILVALKSLNSQGLLQFVDDQE